MRFLKTISKWIWIAAAFLLLIFILQRVNILPGFKSLFRIQQVSIDKTPILIKEIRAIAELNTASLFHEFAIDSTQPSIIPLNALKKRIVLIAKGKITAGVDLHSLDSARVYIQDDSVRIRLPKAAITTVELNPSSFETFFENGRWSGSEVVAVKMKARKILLEEAQRRGLTNKADEKAREVMKDFLGAAGFKKVNVLSD